MPVPEPGGVTEPRSGSVVLPPPVVVTFAVAPVPVEDPTVPVPLGEPVPELVPVGEYFPTTPCPVVLPLPVEGEFPFGVTAPFSGSVVLPPPLVVTLPVTPVPVPVPFVAT